MSIKILKSLGLLIPLIGLVMILNHAPAKTSSRAPASIDENQKMVKFKPHLGIAGKPNQSIRIQLEVVDGFPSSNEEAATLRATISASNQIDESIDLQWILPPGTELISGQLKETVNNLGTDSITREILVRGFSSEGMPRNITLEANSHSHGNLVGSTGVIRSHPTTANLNIGFRKSKEALDQETFQESSETPSGKAQAPKGLRL